MMSHYRIGSQTVIPHTTEKIRQTMPPFTFNLGYHQIKVCISHVSPYSCFPLHIHPLSFTLSFSEIEESFGEKEQHMHWWHLLPRICVHSRGESIYMIYRVSFKRRNSVHPSLPRNSFHHVTVFSTTACYSKSGPTKISNNHWENRHFRYSCIL